jgi:PKD repeat protein
MGEQDTSVAGARSSETWDGRPMSLHFRRATMRATLAAAISTALWLGSAQPALADHAQPAFQPSLVDYTPIGHYGPVGQTIPGGSATIPNPSGGPPPVGPNPTGKWVAYDTNVWESLALPSRHPGDNCNSLPAEEQDDCVDADLDPDDELQTSNAGATGYSGPDGTSTTHGFCPQGDPTFAPFGKCFNNQLEYLDYFERSMNELLGEFGVVTYRYGFQSPGTGGRGAYLDAAGGQAYNVAAVVPGADHPEETVLVSGHYDFTDSGPAAAWDSAEGHTEVMRIAYIMADYWRKTGTRPSATVKFIPWDSEESGTFGSADYVENNIPPGEEDQVRGYFNMDPCAGAYPAYKDGTAERVDQVLQLANPANARTPEIAQRMEAFNARAETIVDEVFDRLDDTITRPGGATEPIFVSDAEAAAGNDGTQPVGSSQRGNVVTAVGGLLLFTSDYANFEDAGIPIFNFFPDLFGPHANGSPASPQGLEILHTPNDNLTRINRLTTGLATGNVIDPTGMFASEGWAKGQEMCAQMEGTYMLQPEMGGAQEFDGATDVVAYFEALPNEATKADAVNFDAAGSHRVLQINPRQVSDADLTYQWDFGDGQTGSGEMVQHTYDELGVYDAVLTVTHTPSGQSDTMTIPITVASSFDPPELKPLPAQDPDGTFPLEWTFDGDPEGFKHFSIQQSTDIATFLSDDGGDLAANFSAEPPTEPAIDPWQASDSSEQKNRGNLFRSEPRSFYTGLSRSDHTPGVEPNGGRSVLALNEPLTLPAGRPAELTYWSDFANDANDAGLVEAAVVDPATGQPGEWQVVDSLGLNAKDDYVMSLSEEPTEANQPRFELRSVNLTRFAGRTIRLRWVYQLGDAQFVNVYRMGWYVDDIKVTSATYSEIGTTPLEQKSFPVTGRGPGTYGYRVVGVYQDEIETKPSNVEVTTVPGEGGGGGGGTAGGGAAGGGGTDGGGGQGSACASASARATPTGIGPARLGRTRAGHRAALGRASRSRSTIETFCLAGGGALRIGYPSNRLLGSLSAFDPRRLRGKAVLILSSSGRTSIKNIRPGMSSRSRRSRLGRRRGIRVGSNVWYVARGSRATLVFKESRGRVREVGLANRRLTRGRARARRFLNSFR